ncbi:hypothetical protein HNO89_002146 [Sporosarcina luteola]|nr:hypothetical protein [Sporosarcina luteola]
MVKETNPTEKRTKKILPFVMSTSMLTAAVFGAGGSAFAAEKQDQEFKNHGAEVSYYATSIPGSPEKGTFMRTIANKNVAAVTPDEEKPEQPGNEEDVSDTPTDDDVTLDPPVDEEAADTPTDEDATPAAPADEEEAADAPAVETATPDTPVN